MAIFESTLTAKRIRHRGLYEGKEQTVSSRYRVAAGGSVAVADSIRMVPLGENVRPMRITLIAKTVSGAPVLTNPSFSVGVEPMLTTDLARPDGTTYPPLTANATRLGAATAFGTDEMVTYLEIDTPTDNPKWGPFYVTLKPAGAGAFSVAGGEIDLICEVVFLGEQSELALVYDQFVNPKYKNP